MPDRSTDPRTPDENGDRYAGWIGRAATATETITGRLVDHFSATFGAHLAQTDCPPGLFWALMPAVAAAGDLGRDGHPKTGLFLPPLPMPRRMWAGGALTFHRGFHPGDAVTRSSVIEKIAFKSGSTGPLGFVTVRHVYSVGEDEVLNERQDIVYRRDPAPGATAAARPQADPGDRVLAEMRITPDPVLLFRFSALTFNGHRIHYDLPYARDVEGYAGLVVHGPLQAILMLNLATRHFGLMPASFEFRALSPLIAGTPTRVEALPVDGSDDLTLRVLTEDGALTMTGRAQVPGRIRSPSR